MRSLLIMLGCLIVCISYSQDYFQPQRARWLALAAESTPSLKVEVREPVGVVSIVKDSASFQGWKAVPYGPMDSLYTGSFKKKSGIILDFGNHFTGFFSFSLEDVRGVADAPIRLKFIFSEVPAEVVTPFDPYEGGLSRAWLQDEIITVTQVPSTTVVPRRLSFRYVRIELLGSSRFSDFRINRVELKSTTSATAVPDPLPASVEPLIRSIDKVGVNTLKECMQTVYEDGPKRDRRLWIGDLYLEAKANTYSFRNHELTKHCLYLLAALSNSKGYLNGNVFETPEPHPQENVLFDYALLYNVTLKDYYETTNDKETALDLWEVAKKQVEIPGLYLKDDGSLDYDKASKEWWVFIDWRSNLHKEAALYGVVIFALKETYALGKLLGKEGEVSKLPALTRTLTQVARKKFYNAKEKVFVSGPDNQISYASQAWMILSGVATRAEGKVALAAVAQNTEAVQPGAPYLYHYVLQAMIDCGMSQEAKRLLTNYWGGMVNKGADTFWEVYDPNSDFLSPYNSFVVNSYCHAWSCTPVYFIRKYPEVFQK